VVPPHYSSSLSDLIIVDGHAGISLQAGPALAHHSMDNNRIQMPRLRDTHEHSTQQCGGYLLLNRHRIAGDVFANLVLKEIVNRV
jgi:hypothetical protein